MVTFWELILAWHLSVVCFASPTVHWISIKNRIVLAFAVISKLRFTFYCNFHDAVRAILFNNVCNIVTDNKLPEHFDCLSDFELLRVFLVCLPDDEASHISVAVLCTVDDFLKSCNRFWQHPHNLVHHLCVIRAFLLYFCIFFFYINSSWHDNIAAVRLTSVEKLSLNKLKFQRWILLLCVGPISATMCVLL